MDRKKEELLRPEDATSLEEFQARKVVEQARIRGMNGSWKTIGKIALSSVIAFLDIFFWFAFDKQTGAGKWVWLVIALVFLGLFLRIFGKIELRGAGGTKRYVQLDRLDKEWQARAERGEIPRGEIPRGEIPRAAPGGPKVWKDQPEDQEAETS